MKLVCTCEGAKLQVTPTEQLMSERSVYTPEECHMIMDLFGDCADEVLDGRT